MILCSSIYSHSTKKLKNITIQQQFSSNLDHQSKEDFIKLQLKNYNYCQLRILFSISMKFTNIKKKTLAKPKLDKIVQMTNEETQVVKYSLIKSHKLHSRPSIKNQIMLVNTRTEELCGWLSKLFCCCVPFMKIYEIPKKNLSNKQLKKQISVLQKLNVKPFLPKQELPKRKTLVLDVDQTLLHSGFKLQSYDFVTNVQRNGQSANIMTKQRPGLQYFLSQMSKCFQIIIFNSSVQYYSLEVTNKIDPKGLIKYRLFRQHCITINNVCMKNLKLLNRDMNQVVLLDNNKNSGLIQPQNLLLIPNFYDNEKDRQLIKIIPFLKSLSRMNQIRNVSQHKMQYDNQIIDINQKQQQSFQPSLQTGSKMTSMQTSGYATPDI